MTFSSRVFVRQNDKIINKTPELNDIARVQRTGEAIPNRNKAQEEFWNA